MTAGEPRSGFEVTMAARNAITLATARHSHPVVVRVAIVPGIPPMARLYLAAPRPGDEVTRFGPACLVVDPGSRWYLEGAIVDHSPDPSPGHFSISGPRLDLLPRPSAEIDPKDRSSRSKHSQPTSRSPD